MASRRPRVLLVNPPVLDFTAYDFWLKPYGLLQVGGMLRGRADLCLFDAMDRLDPRVSGAERLRRDDWDRGEFFSRKVPTPDALAAIRRRFRRFGLPRKVFRQFLHAAGPFDFVLVQTGMTYWYLGVREVIEDLREICPQAGIVLGGVYATLCPGHAAGLGADLVVQGADLTPLWRRMGLEGDTGQPAWWEGYDRLHAAAVKISDGCPFRCTYCSVPRVDPTFRARPTDRILAEWRLLLEKGVSNVAFYDDALLHEADTVLMPLLDALRDRGWLDGLSLHTPNALNARFITPRLADGMVQSGFQTFYLGFESGSHRWQRQTGGKVTVEQLARAVEDLTGAGADRTRITAYVILGHPLGEPQEVAEAMHLAHGLGIRIMLAEFSPIPGTADGQACGGVVDMAEPLWHNKTAFTIRALGRDTVNRLKHLCRQLNETLDGPA